MDKVELRRAQAINLYNQNHSYTDIGKALKVSPTTARRDVQSMLARQPESLTARKGSVDTLGWMMRPGKVSEIKSTNNPLLDWFYNITPDNDEILETPEGMALAFALSVWVYRCCLARAQALASIPLEVVDNKDKPLYQHPLYGIFDGSNTRLMQNLEYDRCIFGAGFWLPLRDGQSITIKRLNPQTMYIEADVRGIQWYEQRVTGQITGHWELGELTYFPTYNPNSDIGNLSPLQVAMQAVKVDRNAWTYVERFFANDATPSLLLSTEQIMNDSDYQRVIDWWIKDQQGVANAHKPQIAHRGLKVQQLTAPLKDLVIPELDERTARRILAAFQVPPTVGGLSDSANYATASTERQGFYTETIKPELDLILDDINRQLMPLFGKVGKVRAKWEEVEVLQDDKSAITTRTTQEWTSGLRSMNEARQILHLEPLPVDYFIIGSQLIPRAELEQGKLPQAPAAVNPFGLPSFQSMPTPSLLNAVNKSMGDDSTQALNDALQDAMVKELSQWETKAIKRGATVDFNPRLILPAMASFIRMDLAAVHPVNGNAEAQIKTILTQWQTSIKQAPNPDFATPEEFEAYWKGIDDNFQHLTSMYHHALQELPAKIASALRESPTPNLAQIIATETANLASMLVGTTDAPGPLTKVYLAGGARGNELLQQRKSIKQGGMGIAWDIFNQEAVNWARQYSSSQIVGINETTQKVYQDAIGSWVENGGSLGELADVIEKGLGNLTPPPNWTGGKLAWATSPERAALIAQTETTKVYFEGSKELWKKAGVQSLRFRTSNDSTVCPTCKSLNNEVANIGGTWSGYTIPVHPNCRCFAAPVVD